MHWISQLSDRLKEAAYYASNEYAWTRNDALEVIDWLSAKGLPVWGVELWLRTQPGPTIPTPYIYQWSMPTTDSATKPDAPTQNEMAKRYVSSFEWDENDLQSQGKIPYFNLTV
jgi:hypothetical protein